MEKFSQLVFVLLVLLSSEILSSQSTNYRWKPVTVGGGGWVTGFVVHPSAPDNVYARTDVGGIYKWQTASESWEQLITFERMPLDFLEYNSNLGDAFYRGRAYEVLSIGLDPTDADIVYFAAGGGRYEDAEEGIFMKSTDGGTTWDWKDKLSIPIKGNKSDRQFTERITVDPLNPQVVYYGSQKDGLWTSSDGGENWSKTDSGQIPDEDVQFSIDGTSLFIGVQRIICEPSQGLATNGRTKLQYALVAGFGIYRTNDGGASWSRIYDVTNSGSLPSNSKYFTDADYADGKLYFAIKSERLTIFDGTSFEQTSLTDNRIFDIAVDPNNNDIAYAVINGFSRFYKTENGGDNWITMPHGNGSLPEPDFFTSSLAPWKENSSLRNYLSVGELVIDPFDSNRLWFAEGMGVWRADNIQNTNSFVFKDQSKGIEMMVASDVAASSSYVTFMTWDRVGFTKTTSSLDITPDEQTLNTLDFSTGTSVDIAPNGEFMAAVASDHRGCCGDGDFSGYSEDGGATWSRFGSIVVKPQQRNNVNNPAALEFGEISISANDNSNMVWVSRRLNSDITDIYYTLDKGNSWSKASENGWDNKGFHFLTSKKALTADRVLPGTFYLMEWQNGQMYKSSDKGQTWSSTNASIPKRIWHGQLKAVDGYEGHLWMSTGFDHREPATERGLWRSVDGGESMEKQEGIQDAWAVGYGKAYQNNPYPTIYIYGKINDEWGIYRSVDEGLNWVKVGEYPLGLFDGVTAIAGDPEIFGRVYMGYLGNTFVYGEITSENQPVVGVSVKPTSFEIFEGEKQDMIVAITPFDASNRSVVWNTGDETIASVNSAGEVTGLRTGTTTVTATATNGITGSAEVNVLMLKPVESVSFSQENLTLDYDAVVPLSATILPLDASFQGLRYESSDPQIVAVNVNGEVLGRDIGQATITVTSEVGGKTDEIIVTVVPPDNDVFLLVDHDTKTPAVGYGSGEVPVLFTPNEDNTVSIVANPSVTGENTSANVMKFEKSAAPFQLALYDFQDRRRQVSSVEEIEFKVYGQMSSIFIKMTDATGSVIFEEQQDVSVNNNWTRVTFNLSEALAAGEAEDIAIFPDPNLAEARTYYFDDLIYTFSSDFRPLESISINPDSLSVEVAKTVQASIAYLPSNATNKSILWESLDSSIATVSNGLVTGLSEGNTTIRATSQEGGFVATVPITVFKNEITANKAAVVIDGILEDIWTLEGTIVKPTIGSGYNNSATFGLIWDQTNLYIAALIQDTILFNDSENPWEDDGIEIYIDGNNDKSGSYDASDLQIVLEYSGTEMFTSRPISGLQSANKIVSGGYTIEVAVPWSELNNLTVAETTEIGFSIAVNDDDNGNAREAQVVWAGTANNYEDTSEFGVVILGVQANGNGSLPSPPDNLIATSTSFDTVLLSWVDTSDNENGFRIERKTVTGNYSQIAIVPSNTVTYTDSGLSSKTTYEYRVQSYNEEGASSFTSDTSVTTGGITGSSSIKLEAELETNTDASVSVVHSGFEGSGFLDFGSYVQFDNILVNASDTYDLIIRYANNSGSNRDVEVTVNGLTPVVVPLPDQFDSWSEWGSVTLFGISLISGNNTIRIQNAPGYSGPNIDNIEIVITGSETANLAPLANAGPDQTITNTNGSGTELVILDGSGSSDNDGTIVNYEWSKDNSVVGTEAIISTSFDVGTHVVGLRIIDDGGLESNDYVIVIIKAGSTPPFSQSSGPDGIVDMEAENFTSGLDKGGQSWLVRSNIPNSSENEFLRAEPDNGVSFASGYVGNSPQVNFQVDFVKTGTHYVWIRSLKTGNTDDSVHVGIDGNGSSSGRNMTFSGSSDSWNWSHSNRIIEVPSPGMHEINLWMREDGARIDRILLTTNATYIPDNNIMGGPSLLAKLEDKAIEFDVEDGFTIYPNPSRGLLVIRSTEKGSVVIYNSVGQIVHNTSLEIGDNQLDLKSLGKGMYVVVSTTSVERRSIKLLIE